MLGEFQEWTSEAARFESTPLSTSPSAANKLGFVSQPGLRAHGEFLRSCFFDKVALYGRIGAQFDEIRIGTTVLDAGVIGVVAEPASLALFGLGSPGWD
jgi:hypothetical protein